MKKWQRNCTSGHAPPASPTQSAAANKSLAAIEYEMGDKKSRSLGRIRIDGRLFRIAGPIVQASEAEDSNDPVGRLAQWVAHGGGRVVRKTFIHFIGFVHGPSHRSYSIC